MTIPGVDQDRLQHWCRYVVVKKTIKEKAGGQRWQERCRCQRSVTVDCTFVVEGRNSPAITKYWYDREGNLERVTGYNKGNGSNA